MKNFKQGRQTQWGLAMLLAFSMATSVFAQVEPTFAITEQPTAVTVVEKDSSVMLSFVAQMGDENVSYQWYSSADGSKKNAVALKGADESSFETGAISEKGVRYYFCVASVGEKSVTSDVAAVAYTGLPVLYVDTPKGVEITSKEDWTKKTNLKLKDAEDFEWNFNELTTSIRGRGNSTWQQPKKPYALKLNEKTEIMDMPKHKRWVLIANYLDNSFLKNHMAFYLSKKLGMDYTVRGEFVNLVFNGVYRGLYWLGEAIKVDKKRVNIYDGEDEMADTDDKDLLIEMDSHYDEVVKFTTPIRKMPYMIKNDDYFYDEDNDNAMTSGGTARLERFQTKIATLENLLYPDYNTNDDCKANTNNCSAPDESYADIIDVESWAKFWLINEIMDNTELNEPKSAYFSYQNNVEDNGRTHDVFKAGPVWDFDAGATTTDAPVRLDTSIYYNALFKSPKFIQTVKDVWNEFATMENILAVSNEIERMTAVLAVAAKLDSLRWGAHRDYVETKDFSFDGNVAFLTQSLVNKVQTVNSYVEKLTNLGTLDGEYVAVDGEVLTGTLGNYKISIAAGATVTLNGVTINGVNEEQYPWAGITCLGDCNIILEGDNIVKGFLSDYSGIYVSENYTLTISGTGSLNASSNGNAAGIGCGWSQCGNIVISGGSVTAEGGFWSAGIGCGYHGTVGNIIINGGTVDATGGSSAANIGSGYGGTVGNITISGGTVTATSGEYGGAGIGGGYEGTVGNITITDNVTKVTATKGKNAPYSIGQDFYGSRTGNITIGGVVYDDIEESPFVYPKTTEFAAVQILDYNSSKRAVIDGAFSDDGAVNITEDIEVAAVDYNREFSNVGRSTLVLPFSIAANKIGGVRQVIAFTGIDAEKAEIGVDFVWCAEGDRADIENCPKNDDGILKAYTPYIIEMAEGTTSLTFDGSVTLQKTPESSDLRMGDWVFRSMLTKKTWTADDPEINCVHAKGKSCAYGYAAMDMTDEAGNVTKETKGKFVRLAAGAYIYPLRAYLVYDPEEESAPAQFVAPANASYVLRPDYGVELPDDMDVVVKNGEGKTTVIGKFNTRTGEFKMNYDRGMFDLKGRSVGNKANKARGAYYGKSRK